MILSKLFKKIFSQKSDPNQEFLDRYTYDAILTKVSEKNGKNIFFTIGLLLLSFPALMFTLADPPLWWAYPLLFLLVSFNLKLLFSIKKIRCRSCNGKFKKFHVYKDEYGRCDSCKTYYKTGWSTE